jgi:prenylcysteine alpha-carboxyl methylesterase
VKPYHYRNICVLLGLRNPDTTRGKKSLVEGFQWVELGLQNCCRIMEGEDSLLHFSPEALVHSSDFKQAATQLPPVALFHGTSDYSIPCDAR